MDLGRISYIFIIKCKTKNTTLSEQFQNTILSEQFQNTILSEQFQNTVLSEQFQNTILSEQFQNTILSEQFQNRKYRGNIDRPNTCIHDCSFSWLGMGASIKCGVFELVLWASRFDLNYRSRH